MSINVESNSSSSNNDAQTTSFTETSSTDYYLNTTNNTNATFIVKDNENNIEEEINMKKNDYVKDLSIFIKDRFKTEGNNYKLIFKNQNGLVYILGKHALYDDKDRISKIFYDNYIIQNKIHLELTHIIVEPVCRFNLNRIACRICNMYIANQVIYPCRHVIYCSNCVADRQYRGEFNYCGECGSNIQQTNRLIFNNRNN